MSVVFIITTGARIILFALAGLFAQQGVLTLADGGVAVLAMAERLAPATAARLAAVLDMQEVALERDGLATRHATRFGVIALDESLEPEEALAAPLLDRLAFRLDLDGLRALDGRGHGLDAEAICTARVLLPHADGFSAW